VYRMSVWWMCTTTYEERLNGMWGRVNHSPSVHTWQQVVVLKENAVHKLLTGVFVVQVTILLSPESYITFHIEINTTCEYYSSYVMRSVMSHHNSVQHLLQNWTVDLWKKLFCHFLLAKRCCI